LSQVARHCANKLHLLLAEDVKSYLGRSKEVETSDEPLRRAISSTFNRMDAGLSGLAVISDRLGIDGRESIPATVGTTALGALLGGGRIVVAHCGDSRAVLSRGGDAVPLSVDHKASAAGASLAASF
jgi:protein phosphatase 2C